MAFSSLSFLKAADSQHGAASIVNVRVPIGVVLEPVARQRRN
jgi:hypothetical protein